MSDHRPDLYDLIEIEGPPDQPLPRWLTADYVPCQDCRANLFLRWNERGAVWEYTIAHDDGCPFLAKIEGRRR